MAQLTDFGKAVKKRLVDMDQTQEWLYKEITERTGLFMDSGYWYKIASGKVVHPRIQTAVCEILSMKIPQEQSDKTDIEKRSTE